MEDFGPSYGLSGILTLFERESQTYTYADELKFWDPHSFDKQRLYSILCFVYDKKGPNAFPEGFIDSKLHNELNSCKVDYEKMKEDWKRVLKPYLKSDSNFV